MIRHSTLASAAVAAGLAAMVLSGCSTGSGDAPAKTGSLGIEFGYAGGKKYFKWRGDFAAKHAEFDADFGAGRATLPAAAGLLAPEMALSEAMFF